MDWKTKREIKSYAKKRFGSSSFWPWLAVYTELRGEFKRGWVPDDYYLAVLLEKYNPEKARISEYKTFDFRMFPDFALQPLLIKIGPNYYNSENQKIPGVLTRELLQDYGGEVVVKEDLSLGGHRVEFIASRDLDLEKYSQIPSYVVQPVMEQHEQLKILSPHAVCSIRIFTFLDGKGEVKVKYTALRFGLGGSRVTNTSSGGGSCFINPNGTLDKRAHNKLGIKMGDRHPDNEVLFESVRIPNYRAMVDKCKQCHEQFPYVRFIGWDVAVNRSGDPVLLEWNSEPGFWKAEALLGPFFRDNKF